MSEISLEIKAKIVILGFSFSLLGVLMLYAFFARIINDFAIDLLSGNNILLLIILGVFIITLIVATGVGVLLTEDMSRSAVLKASAIALLATFIVILGISYLSLGIFYPGVYSELVGFDIILAFPSILTYFSLYVLQNTFLIYLIMLVIYFIFYLVFLETFYEFEARDKYYDKIFEDFKNWRF